MKTKLIAVAISAVMLSSCADMMKSFPQTTAEFKTAPKIQKLTYTVPRSLSAVVASLEKARKCVSDEAVETKMGGGGMVSTSRDLRYMTLERPLAGPRGAHRWAMSNGLFQPKGGYFRLVGDLEAQGPTTTKVTLHHGGPDELINALKEWSRGRDQSCHGYDGQA